MARGVGPEAGLGLLRVGLPQCRAAQYTRRGGPRRPDRVDHQTALATAVLQQIDAVNLKLTDTVNMLDPASPEC